MFDDHKNKFIYSPEFSSLARFYIDEHNSEISSTIQFTGGNGGETETYWLRDGELFLIEVDYSYRDSRSKSIYYNNDMIQYLEKDSNKNDTIIYTKFAINGESKILLEKNWRIYINKLTNKANLNNKTIYKDFDGNYFKMIKKEVYFYEEGGKNIFTRKTKRFKVINDQWIEVDNIN